ncbi:hypothetical protein HRbin02_00170 [Candidatus Calditenuaceae archaeon HR02]|nr:hypothetical protein HRbin02_00170 [Candidatus Calditenuaceae archaeon HR02]
MVQYTAIPYDAEMRVLVIYMAGVYIVSSNIRKAEALALLPLVVVGVFPYFLFHLVWSGCLAVDRTELNSLMLIVQFSVQAVFSPVMVILGFGIWGVALVYLILVPLSASIPSLFMLLRVLSLSRPSLSVFEGASIFWSSPLW